MPLIAWSDYPELISGMANGSWKVIGWGAGVGFINFHESTLIKHDYLVDSDSSKWGSYVGGFEVKPPISIASEDISKTIIIIYNFYDHGQAILTDLEKIGPYKSIMNFNPAELFNFSKRLTEGIGELDFKPQANSKFGIVVQGPFYDGNTLSLLKYYANKYPRDWLILSTWDDTPEFQLDLARKYCDTIVTNFSVQPGYGNRNSQITSTYSGLKKAKELGVEFVLKTRTNTIATGFDILNRSQQFLLNYNSDNCNELGLKNRIIVTERYTHRYIPYLISDIVMYGYTDDLLSFFSAPHDNRNLKITDIQNATIETIGREGYLTEIYLVRNFLDKIGWDVKNNIADYWSVLRNLFIIVDERWFGHYFPRYEIANLDGVKKIHDLNSYVDFNFWVSLCNDEELISDVNNFDLAKINYSDLIANYNFKAGGK
jgi:hypothetical protein